MLSLKYSELYFLPITWTLVKVMSNSKANTVHKKIVSPLVIFQDHLDALG